MSKAGKFSGIDNVRAQRKGVQFQGRANRLQKREAGDDARTQPALSRLLENQLHRRLAQQRMAWHGVDHRLPLSQVAHGIGDALIELLPIVGLVIKIVKRGDVEVREILLKRLYRWMHQGTQIDGS